MQVRVGSKHCKDLSMLSCMLTYISRLEEAAKGIGLRIHGTGEPGIAFHCRGSVVRIIKGLIVLVRFNLGLFHEL
jgi:hypothetical protein